MAVVKYFGAIAEATKCHEEKITIENQTVSEVVDLLKTKYDFKTFDVRLALNQNMVESTSQERINDNDELALLPPFAGG